MLLFFFSISLPFMVNKRFSNKRLVTHILPCCCKAELFNPDEIRVTMLKRTELISRQTVVAFSGGPTFAED